MNCSSRGAGVGGQGLLEFPLLHLLLNIPAAAAVIHRSDSICCFDSWGVQIPRTGHGFLRGRAGFVGGLGCRVFKFLYFYTPAHFQSGVMGYNILPLFILLISSSAGWSPNSSTSLELAWQHPQNSAPGVFSYMRLFF